MNLENQEASLNVNGFILSRSFTRAFRVIVRTKANLCKFKTQRVVDSNLTLLWTPLILLLLHLFFVTIVTFYLILGGVVVSSKTMSCGVSLAQFKFGLRGIL